MINDERLTDYINSLAKPLPESLRKIEKEALENHVPIIRKDMQSLLCFLLKTTEPANILEVGCAVGFSALLMESCVDSCCRITTIEKVPARIAKARDNFEKLHKSERITLLEGDAVQLLQELNREKKKYDFIFMDAAKGQYMNFFGDIYDMLEEKGMLVTDNVLQDGDIIKSRYAVTRRDRTIHGRMREYLYTLTHHQGLDTVILPVGDGVALSVKG